VGRILCIDFGLARIGLALSDPSKIIASPYKTIQTQGKEAIRQILKEIDDLDIERIVIGLPLLLSGKDSETTKSVRTFASLLKSQTDLPIILWDERLTSKQVEKTLISGGIKRKKRAKLSDRLSAALILQSFLDSTFH
jgi:putative Holliday junction resolvase